MHRAAAVGVIAATGVLSVLLAAFLPAGASAGQFTVASCQADRVNFSTTAFNDFATRGMTVRRACNPEGPGIRGLVTANSTRRGSVPRGSVAMVAFAAPSGTRFTKLRWAGSARRRDCRYALQLYAEGPDVKPVAIKNVRANRNCPRRPRAQAAGYRLRTFNISGATRVVQRVICVGGDGRQSCSARGTNYIRTYQAKVEVVDEQAPTATIAADTPLAAGAWVSGSQPLHYDAQDNVGVRLAQAVAGDRVGGYEQRPCTLATPEGAYANGVPCPNGVGQITVKTSELSEGTQPLVVQPHDTAGNVGASAPTAVRIDNTAPARVGVAVDGGDAWRNRNDFALRWTNPPENDRAPIVAAAYKLCPAANGGCTQSEQAADSIASLPVQVPGSGEWTVWIWRRDAAGNADQATASDPVTLRYDPEPPQLAFDAPSASDPTLVSAPVTDKVSGLAGGTIEISAAGSSTWQTLNTETNGSRLVARIDDAAMPPGSYLLRATAWDQAQNHRELARIAGERQCREVDRLADRQVRIPARGEIGDSATGLDRVDAGEDRVAGAFGQQVHAEHAAAVALGDELDDAVHVAADDRARHVLEAQHTARAVDALRVRLRLGHAGRSDRRGREGDARQRRVVDVPPDPVEGVLDRDRCLLGGHVDELRMTGDVPRCPHARVRCAHVVPDQHLATGSDLDADRVQRQADGARAPASRHEQLLGAKLAAARHDDDVAAVAAHCAHLDAFDHVDAVGSERLADPGGDLRLLAACQPGADEHGHPRTEVSEQLGLLERDVATAKHDHRGRKVVELHRRRRRQVAAVTEP